MKSKKKRIPISPDFSAHWRSLSADQKKELAVRCNTDVQYLHQIANGDRNPGKGLAKKLEVGTGIPRTRIRPDLVQWLSA